MTKHKQAVLEIDRHATLIHADTDEHSEAHLLR